MSGSLGRRLDLRIKLVSIQGFLYMYAFGVLSQLVNLQDMVE